MLWRTREKRNKWHKGILGLLGGIGAGLASSWFGGNSGDSGGSEGYDPRIMGVSSLSKQQKRLRNRLGRQIWKGLSKRIKPYQGDYAAPLTALQQESIQGARGMMPDIMSAFRNVMSEQGIEDYVSAQQKEQTALAKELGPMVHERFTGTGNFWSESAQKAMGDYWGKVGRGISTDTAKARLDSRRMGMQAAGGALNPMVQAMGLGEGERSINQMNVTGKFQSWLRTRKENNPYIQQAMQFLGIPMTTQMGVQGMQGMQGGGGIGGMLGNAASGIDWGRLLSNWGSGGGAGGANLMSDMGSLIAP